MPSSPNRGGRPPKITPLLLKRAQRLIEKMSVADAASEIGVSKSQLYIALAAAREQAEASTSRGSPPALSTAIDPSGNPLDIMRGLLASVSEAIATLLPDSPRINPARAEARALAKAIAALEHEQAKAESPEEAERRRRREDGETRREIEQYVVQAELAAAAPRPGAPWGVCTTCGQAHPSPPAPE